MTTAREADARLQADVFFAVPDLKSQIGRFRPLAVAVGSVRVLGRSGLSWSK